MEVFVGGRGGVQASWSSELRFINSNEVGGMRLGWSVGLSFDKLLVGLSFSL